MIIVVVNNKGGVGKSTLAVHLAAWLHEQGHKVILADCDLQQSSSSWVREAVPELKTVCLQTPDLILDKLPDLAADADYVVADGPGSSTENTRSMLLRGDLALVPCKASMLEVRALSQATYLLQQSRGVRKGEPPAIGILSMVGRNYRLTKDMKDAAAVLNLPLANTAITLKQVYADAPGQGTLVWNMGTRANDAAEEMRTLFHELLPEAVRKSRSKSNTLKKKG